MIFRGKSRQLSVILIASSILTLSTTSANAERGASPQVISGDGLTKQQFELLPDTALIDFKARRMTKANIRAREARGRIGAEKIAALADQNRIEFKQRLTQLEQQRKTQLEVERTKAIGEFARLNQAGTSQLKAIAVEAAQLQERSKRASSAEKAQIEQRAEQLLRQLQLLKHR